MSNKTYDVLKGIAQLWLPAAAPLVLSITSIWGLPYGEPVSGTIMAVDAFLGAVLQISSNAYHREEG